MIRANDSFHRMAVMRSRFRFKKFCERFLQKRDRTYDQMVQAARSGKQNILEGCQASGTSKEMEIKLIKWTQKPPRQPK
jgi:hypothetical protein